MLYLVYARLLRNLKLKELARRRLAARGVDPAKPLAAVGVGDPDADIEFVDAPWAKARKASAESSQDIMTVEEQGTNLEILRKLRRRNRDQAGASAEDAKDDDAVAGKAPPLSVEDQVELRRAIDRAMARYRVRLSARASSTIPDGLLKRDRRASSRSSASSVRSSAGASQPPAIPPQPSRLRRMLSPRGGGSFLPRIFSPRGGGSFLPRIFSPRHPDAGTDADAFAGAVSDASAGAV